ncbi:zinc finger protein ZAT1-like [Cucumis melo var. makuwa]|uniref:Zinc finger protein ZAT1-like n=2 Tax=Cucumis melo TaxID=3656 RepID=A0A5A7US47_CUCMM|nr:zinc finger protein ZAT1-like [Cucumis melo]KAA0057980.1 zinc finger protein ZAT1-like [Cucumis melo var. makuwa]
MEANLVSRHVCKLCNKSFACGRSLGGHMRSHLTNNLAENDEKHSRTSLQLGNYSGGSLSNMEEEIDFGYGLRKNPKKTQKLEFLSEESSLQDKFCRECGKGFQSWKALFGHMKCHSERGVVFSSSQEEVEEPDSHITDAKQKMVMDIQSDNENEVPNNKRKRSRRRRTSNQMGTANSTTSFSFATNSSSVSDIEQEQEVAISLMLLSMDMGNWVGFNSPAESSDNNSKFLEAPSVVESKTSVSNGCELVKSNKLKGKKMEFEVKQSEERAGSTMIKKSQLNQRAGSKSSLKKNEQNQGRFSSDMFFKSPKKTLAEFWDSKICKKPKKRSKFECDICNKIFDSYQALGGHRASHKKLKGCFIESAMEDEEEEEDEEEIGSESSGEMTISANPKAESKGSKGINNGGRIEKNSKHKCPICEKVFASGQALGGHKRSHLMNGSETKNRETIQIQKQVPEIRRFLDLNLPPEPVERESKDHNLASLNPSWWVAANEHKHEALVNVGFHI